MLGFVVFRGVSWCVVLFCAERASVWLYTKLKTNGGKARCEFGIVLVPPNRVLAERVQHPALLPVGPTAPRKLGEGGGQWRGRERRTVGRHNLARHRAARAISRVAPL